MSLPPVTVHIKRKATDEPVDFLHVEESAGKRQRRRTDFIFSRQPTPDTGIDSLENQPTPPSIPKIKQLSQSAVSPSLGTPATAHNVQAIATQTQDATNQDSSAPPPDQITPTNAILQNAYVNSTPIPSPRSQPRRFHIISRSTTPSNTLPTIPGASRKRKAEPTVFVERRSRPKSSEGQSLSSQSAQALELEAEQPRPQKKPGLAARSATPPVRPSAPPKSAPAPLRNVRLPSGLMMPWDVTSDRLAAEMQAYTLQEIGKTLAESEASRPIAPSASTRVHRNSPSKFKPKKPTLRYAERHPEEKTDTSMDVDSDEHFIDEEVDDESEYIIDTYIRIPVDDLKSGEGEKNIGLLVLKSQPDIDEFYREDSDSDEEEEDEEEDENAENHYTADYPDEEVDSDDEFDRNPYHYRTHNASDLEEFDEDDATFSDDENESTKYPWMKKPWMKRPSDTVMGEDEDE